MLKIIVAANEYVTGAHPHPAQLAVHAVAASSTNLKKKYAKKAECAAYSDVAATDVVAVAAVMAVDVDADVDAGADAAAGGAEATGLVLLPKYLLIKLLALLTMRYKTRFWG